MLGVEARADGRREIADNRFGDSKKAKRSFAQAILQQSDKRAEQQASRRIAAAQAEINGDEQRQIENSRFGDVHRQKRLRDHRDNHAEQNRATEELVDFDVRFADAQVESVV